MLVKYKRFAMAALMSLSAAAAAQAPAIPSISDFALEPEIVKPQLSPNGEFIAALATTNDQTSLLIFDAATRKPISGLRLYGKDDIINYWWSGKNEVIASMGSDDGSEQQAIATGEMMVLKAEAGASPRYLIGQRGSTGVAGSRVKVNSDTYIAGFASMIDPTPDNDKTAVIAIDVMGSSAVAQPSGIYEIDTDSSRRRLIATLPSAQCLPVVDSQGNLRFAVCGESAVKAPELHRFKGAAGWEKVATPGLTGFEFLFSSRDQQWMYFAASGIAGSPSDATCLAKMPSDASKPMTSLSCVAGADIEGLIPSADRKDVLAAYYDLNGPQLDVLPTQHPDAELLIALQQSFDGQLAVPVSASRDGKQWLLEVFSDSRPPSYFLFNTQTKEAKKLFEGYPKLANARHGKSQGVQYTSRDGRTMFGYLTLPNNAPAGAKPPMIVMPHGGPIDLRDRWAFDPEVQLLASRGYAVLRVNFRGSGGYGASHRYAGLKAYGAGMIDDITDGVKHVVAKGLVDAQRIGIFGASYGGYAAVMSGVKEPNLYKGIVTYVGMSDLERMRKDSDITNTSEGRSVFAEFLGNDPALLKQQSPIHFVQQLKAPVFIVHGKADERVPISQAEALRDALDRANRPYDWLVKNDEGHGFVRHAAKLELYERLIRFLDQNVKGSKS